jgi:hypothetical protein
LPKQLIFLLTHQPLHHYQTGKIEGVQDLEGITEIGFRVESLE